MFRVTDADVVRACTIGNRAVASRGSSRLSPRRKSKEPLSRRVRKVGHNIDFLERFTYLNVNGMAVNLLVTSLKKTTEINHE